MSDSIEAPFFLAGGALSVDAPSYIARQADEILFASLLRGEFCYVLVSRQMGKSSLMVRTAARLRKEGVAAVVLDLNAIGHNLEREQWYYSLILQIGRKLNIRAQIKSWWEQSTEQSGVQKWVGALEHILQNYVSERLVLFIDEIDQVQLLPSSAQEGRTADEFFAAVRSCYSRRSEDAEFHRLTFCLLGVALPSDLISDHRITPFNIGTRIELADFDERQVLTFKAGLEREEIVDEALLSRVYYWTGGHPYLTQRLCRAIVEAPEVGTPAQVDKLCERLFLSSDAQEQDDNLLFVRDRLLKSDTDIAELLTLYGRIVRGKHVDNDKANRLISILLLSGIVRSSHGRLEVRNRIYAQVFNREWVRRQMPDAEIRRQKIAYRRGMMRTVALSGSISAVFIVITIFAIVQAFRARTATTNAQRERDSANHLLYIANMNVAHHAWENNNCAQLATILKESENSPDRDFEWDYWTRMLQRDVMTFRGHSGAVLATAFSPDTRIVATGSSDQTVRLWKADSRNPIRILRGHTGAVCALGFSPNGKFLVTGSADHTARIWNLETGHVTHTLWGHSSIISSVAFSADSKRIATGSRDRRVKLWNVKTGKEICTLKDDEMSGVTSVAFSPDGKRVAIGRFEENAEIWEVGSRKRIELLVGHASQIDSLAFSPDGKLVATGSWDRSVKIWDSQTAREVRTLTGHTGDITALAFSSDGRRIVTGSDDMTSRIWNTADGRILSVLKGHTAGVTSVAYSHDNKYIITGSDDMTAKLWSAEGALDTRVQSKSRHRIAQLTISPDGKNVAYGTEEGEICVSSTAEPRVIDTFHLHPDLRAVAYSPDGRRFVTAGLDGCASLWDPLTGSKVIALSPQYDNLNSAVFSPDGTLVAVGGGTGEATVWSTIDGSKLASYRHSPRKSSLVEIRAVLFSPTGKDLLTAGDDGVIKMWDVATRRLVRSFRGHRASVLAVAFSPEGHHIISGSADKTAIVWDASTGKAKCILRGHSDKVAAVAYLPGGKEVVTVSWDRTIRFWSPVTGSVRRIVSDGKRYGLTSLSISPHARYLITGSFDGTAILWDSVTGKTLHVFRQAMDVDCVAFSPDGKRLVTGSDDGTAVVWETVTGRKLATASCSSGVSNTWGPIVSLQFSTDGHSLIAADANGTVATWNWPTEQQTAQIQLPDPGVDRSFPSIGIAHDGTWVAAAYTDNTVKLFSCANGIPKELCSVHDPSTVRSVSDIAFALGAKRIVIGMSDGTVDVWDIGSKRLIATYGGHTGRINAVAFSPDGKSVVTVGGTKAIVREVSTGRILASLEGHSSLVNSVCFSPNGRRIVTGSWDRSAKVWDTATGRELLTLNGHQNNVAAVVFAPDGKRIFTGSWDKTLRKW